MNSWEEHALRYQYPEYSDEGDALGAEGSPWAVGQSSTYDPIIYPGLYSASGYDMMGILLHILGRPDPQVDLGAIDASCPLLMCDLKSTDNPIVYVSDAFCTTTGYDSREIMGRNCRFLQSPGGKVRPRSTRAHVDRDTIRRMRRAVEKNAELQIEVVNFKKDGQMFVNMLTIVPIRWQSSDYNYSVGFMCEKDDY